MSLQYEILSIPTVTAVVFRCWLTAEDAMRANVADRFYDKDEEFITEMFHGEFRAAIREASSKKEVQEAFLRDLNSAFRSLRSRKLAELASGIEATVTLHSRTTEGKSGGDFGLVLVRPNITAGSRGYLSVNVNYRRGLLCQAKIKRRASGRGKPRWGEFTKKQREILPARLAYLALVLYEYTDAERRLLAPFRWMLCNGVAFEDIEKWLTSNKSPDGLSSRKIIELLGQASIGTADEKIIDEYISPHTRDALIVKIGWRPGGEPPAHVRVKRHGRKRQEQVVQVYRR